LWQNFNLAQGFACMLHYGVSIYSMQTTDAWWRQLRPRLTLIYLAIALALLFVSAAGHMRLLGEVGKVFGGFFWALDTDNQVVIVSTPPQLQPFDAADSLTSTSHIVAVNGIKGSAALTRVYQHVQSGEQVTYTIQAGSGFKDVRRPTVRFTQDMWWQNYGLALVAGISWLLAGVILLGTAQDWGGAVEGITLLPPSMLFLLYSHWGNVQQDYHADAVFQLLWVPSFALLGAAFIHLSLSYRPEMLGAIRLPRLTVDGAPYLPLLALLAYEWSSYAFYGHVPTRPNLIISLGYGVLGGIISFAIGIHSLIRVGRLIPSWGKVTRGSIPSHIRRRVGDLLTLWIGGVGLGFCLGVLPILLTGHTLLPLSMFYVLATMYPLILSYAIRSLRLVDRLQVTLEQREEALREQQKTAEELRQTNRELKQATSLLLHADAHLRSILSQRIHDQPKQQALRIRSLLGHWQHKLRIEAEHDPSGKVAVQPVIDVLGKVRKISEELEGDLRGLQLLVEDAYQRRSLGLKLHLEKLIREDLPALHPESPLKVQPDLWALDAFGPELEQTQEGARVAEAISYTVTQALLNVYNHAGATYATVRTVTTSSALEVYVIDDGRGFDTGNISPEKTSLFKAQLKAREAGGMITIESVLRPQAGHGTTVLLRIPLPYIESKLGTGPLLESRVQGH
jgi:signal transduction histidine kinase